MALLLNFYHSEKENEPGAAFTSRRRRSQVMNPYSQPLPFNQIERNARSIHLKQAPRSTKAPASCSSAKPTTSSSSLATIEEEETSPTIRRILEKTGCSSRQELLAMRAAQEANTNTNTNGSKSNKNGSKDAPIGSKTATSGADSAATNMSKDTTRNRDKSTNGNKATNRSKAANGSKALTNPKKKAKSKHFC